MANEYDAKFSAQYVVATCLVKGVFGLSELVDSALRDADVLALAVRIDCLPDPDAHYPTYFSGGVEIHLHDGRVLRHHEVVNRGAGDRALSAKEIEQKYFDNALLAVRRSRATDIRDAILSLDSISEVEFARVLALP